MTCLTVVLWVSNYSIFGYRAWECFNLQHKPCAIYGFARSKNDVPLLVHSVIFRSISVIFWSISVHYGKFVVHRRNIRWTLIWVQILSDGQNIFPSKFSLFPALIILEQYMHIEYDGRFYGLFLKKILILASVSFIGTREIHDLIFDCLFLIKNQETLRPEEKLGWIN